MVTKKTTLQTSDGFGLLLVAVYAAVMVLLAYLAVDTHVKGPDLSSGMAALGGVLLGLVLNPKQIQHDFLYVAILAAPIVIGAIAVWKLFTVHPDHPSAGLVVATCIAVFAGLFVDLSKLTQPNEDAQ